MSVLRMQLSRVSGGVGWMGCTCLLICAIVMRCAGVSVAGQATGATPLHIARKERHLEVVSVLVGAGASPVVSQIEVRVRVYFLIVT